MTKSFPTYTEPPSDIKDFFSNNGINTLFRDANIVIPKQGMFESNKGYLTRIKGIYDKEMVKLGKSLYEYEDISNSHSMYDTKYALWQTPEEKEQYLKELEVKRVEKRTQRAKNNQAAQNAKAAKAAKASQNAQSAKDAKVAACRALIAEVDNTPANVTPTNIGGYRRNRTTKKKRNNKTKRSRK